MKTIFECPYEEECHKTKPELFFGEQNITLEFRGCKHPFIEANGKTLCVLEMEDDGDYDKIIKQIKLHKPTLKDRIKRWFK